MTGRSARRSRVGGGGPSPEVVAAALVVILYGLALTIGATVGAGSDAPTATETPMPSTAVASPSTPIDRLRPDINALLEIDGRLRKAREDLRTILAQTNPRGSDVAFVLRRIKTALLPALDRVGRFAADPMGHEVGAQLEILYADASATVDKASDLALGSDPAYRQLAEDIVDLFTDLPAIDERLQGLLEPAVSPAASSVASQAASPTSRPSEASSARPSTGPSAIPSVPPPTPSATVGTAGPPPIEVLRDPGFELGIGPWILRRSDPSMPVTVGAAAPLGATGTRSLQVRLPAVGSEADASIGQSPIRLDVGRHYVVHVSMRSDAVRSAQSAGRRPGRGDLRHPDRPGRTPNGGRRSGVRGHGRRLLCGILDRHRWTLRGYRLARRRFTRGRAWPLTPVRDSGRP